MSILEVLKESMYRQPKLYSEDGDIGTDSEDDDNESLRLDDGGDDRKEKSVGDTDSAKAIVDAMMSNAPDQHTQIGVILKYAANSIPEYDVWDVALDYYESLEKGKDSEPPKDIDEPIDDIDSDELDIADDADSDDDSDSKVDLNF